MKVILIMIINPNKSIESQTRKEVNRRSGIPKNYQQRQLERVIAEQNKIRLSNERILKEKLKKVKKKKLEEQY